MYVAEWSGVIAFVIALIGSVLVCRLIQRRLPKDTDTSGDREYDALVMRSILPNNQGTSIDTVAEALMGQDLSGFHLAWHDQRTQK